MAASEPIHSLLKKALPALSVGAISADVMNLERDVRALEECGAALLHFDIMDGHFAPLLTVGPAFVKGIRTSMFKDVHLMIEDPLESLAAWAAAGADLITIHVESCRHPHRALQRLSELVNANDPSRGIARGAALCPSTPVSALEPLLVECDFVLLVAIDPGFPNQTYSPDTPRRVEEVRRMAKDHPVLIGIDGGVTAANLASIALLGPDMVVTGSAVFAGNGPSRNFPDMARILRGGR